MSCRLSSKDFWRLFELLWEQGPAVRFRNPDAWIKALDF